MWIVLRRMTLFAVSRALVFALVAAALGWLHETPRAGVLLAVTTSLAIGAVTSLAERAPPAWADALSALARATCCVCAAALVVALVGRVAPVVGSVLAAALAGAMASAPTSEPE